MSNLTDQQKVDQSANPSIFVQIGDEPDDLADSRERTRWITDRCQSSSGLDILAFVLLDGFGPDPRPITDFVADNLIRELFGSPKLAEIADRIVESERNGTRWTSNHHNALDSQIQLFLRDTFSRVDSNAYERILELCEDPEVNNRRRGKDEMMLISGCTAMLALFLGRRLVVANYGNSMGIFAKDGSDGLTTIRISEVHGPTAPESGFRCFGDFWSKKTEEQQQAHPQQSFSLPNLTVQPHIELDYSARFVLFATASVWQLMWSVCPANQSLEWVVANFLAKSALPDGKEIEGGRTQNIRNAFDELRNQSGNPTNERMALALIDLQHPLIQHLLDDREDPPDGLSADGDGSTAQNYVQSEVDWDEFYTHHLKEEVLAKCASLRQAYRVDKEQRPSRNLQRISED